MLQQGSAARRERRADLQLRVYVLHRVFDDEAWRALSELRRSFPVAPDPACGQAGQISGINEAGIQTGRMRFLTARCGTAVAATRASDSAWQIEAADVIRSVPSVVGM